MKEQQYKVDQYYNSAFEFYKNHELMKKAGWINENVTIKDKIERFNLNLLTTPLNKIKLSKEKRNKILLTTGSFAPLHNGHIEMLDKAKKVLESRGFHVAGGYISPSHDEYVLTKEGVSLNIYDRIKIIEEKIDNTDYMLDKWEALHTDIAINFTSVIEKLEAYLFRHLNQKVDIVFVFGDDNIEFSYAFIGYGEFVCVERTGKTIESLKFDSNRMFFVKGGVNDISSTKIRKNILDQAKPNNQVKQNSNTPEGSYFIRSDIQTKDNQRLFNIFKIYLDLPLTILEVEDQIKEAKKVIKDPTVSMDVYYKGDLNLNISRLFDISSYQKRSHEVNIRNDDKKWLKEDNFSKEIQYVLVDDDYSTGFSIEKAKEILKTKGIKIKSVLFLNDLYGLNNVIDIVDARDFLLGSDNGGLFVRLPNNKLSRVIYSYPYVNLNTRASIEDKYHILFSINVWRWNYEIFNNEVLTKDNHSYNWLNYIGFKEGTLLKDICLWHIKKMENCYGL